MKNQKNPGANGRVQTVSNVDVPQDGFDWNDLRDFLAVAREGGLSKAALSLGSSAATVSRHIAALERSLQVRLFVRLSTGYLLTDAGSALYERVAEVERSTLAVARGGHAAADGDQVSGLVRLATADSLGATVLTPQLHALRQRHPELRVELLLGHAPVDLARREADLALRLLDPDTHDLQPDHVMHRVGRVPFDLYATRALIGRTPLHKVDWRALDHVSWDGSWRHKTPAQWLYAQYERPPVFTSNSMAAQMAYVRAGHAVGVLPRYLARTDPSLLRLPVSPEPPARELWLICHRDLRSSPRVRAVRQFLDERLPALLDGSDPTD
jgi:DNA-binding transcriptional LysR family regulator